MLSFLHMCWLCWQVGGGDGGRGEKRAAMGESWKNQAHVRYARCDPIAILDVRSICRRHSWILQSSNITPHTVGLAFQRQVSQCIITYLYPLGIMEVLW